MQEIVESSKTRLVEKVYRESAYIASAKRFKIVTTAAKFDAPRRCSTTTYVVSGDKMTPQIQRINRTGAKIVSITEIN
ncbi:MAG: hypothetical protein F6K09_30005 [Merismopedia sp. SIO2A8]|nr:hypothetical protein [Merismopedia sp. SIO2A8]